MTNISATSKNIMSALLAGSILSKEVAAKLEVKTVVVTGSLAGLKKNGFVEVLTDGKLHLTDAGRKIVAPVEVVSTTFTKKGDKKAAAARIVAAMPGSSRKAIMTRLMAELGMSSTQASTYHYNLAGDKGMWNK
jgi:DNA-binding MarR family transcriptional regulator